ncbi:MAG: Ig-like domain-containing protein, partial [Flaviflexus sp.]|nr:Ig-like domain-containing protein [Flaviflexus sp.]
ETITWDEMDEADYSAREGGDFTVNGTVEGWADGVSANVTVTPATIEKIEVTEEITTPAGIHPDLPGTVMVHWSNGDVTEAEPTWEELDELDYAQPTVLDVAGSVCGGPECDFTAQVTVTEAIIVSVSHDDPVVTDSGTAPVLPDTGTAIWSDKMAGDVTLVWDEIDPAHYMAREGGEFTVNGTVDGEDFPVTITVQVNPATKELVADIDPVTTDSGTAPTLPETVTVMWSNGDVTEEPVTWDEIDEADYSGIGGGHFTVNGTVEGMEEGVSVDVHVNPATIESAELAEEVTTPAGVAPEMPETVMVHWSNGDVTEEPVTWHEIDEADYAQSGVIDVTGQLCPDSECVFTVPVTVTDPVDEPTDEPSGQPTDEPTDQPTKPSDQPTHPKDPGKHPAKDPGKHPTHPGKYGNDLPHTGSSVAMLGLISFLMLATGGVLARRYARS